MRARMPEPSSSAHGEWISEFSVRDDGAGFDPGDMRRGYGLINLRDRVSALGGDASVTLVTGQIPLP